MHRVVHRRKAQRRTHLKRFMSDTVHIHQAPLRSPVVGNYTVVSRETGLKETRNQESLFDAFALKSRNKAAQEVFGNVAYVHRGQLIIDTSQGKMMLPIVRTSDGKVYLQRTEGPNLIPRAAVIFKLYHSDDERIDTLYSIVLERGKYNQVKYFFTGRMHILVHMSLLSNIVRRSIVYGDRDTMLRAYGVGNVYWEEFQKISELVPPVIPV